MTRMAVRLDRLEQRRPASPPRTYDLSRLTDDQLDRMLVLRERIELIGPEGLTPDELEELAELADVFEGDASCPALR